MWCSSGKPERNTKYRITIFKRLFMRDYSHNLIWGPLKLFWHPSNFDMMHMLINFDNDIQWNLSPSYIFFVNNYFESVILVHESLCFEGHYVHWPFSLIKSPDPWGYQSLLPEAPYQIFHLCSLNWSEDCFNYCSERNNVVVVWNSQGAVFYSHQSEWLWFADCRHIFYFSQKKRHVKRKKQLAQIIKTRSTAYI